ncbi:MAG: thiamine diphosphokinase [Aggregatilineales bacterium]
MKRALIFVNGELNDGEMVQQTLSVEPTPFVIAADGGARIAQRMDMRVDLLIGDMDSLMTDELNEFAAAGVEIQRFPKEKDETDLELALLAAVERGYDWIRLLGVVGGRLDQLLANMYLLALPELEGRDVRIIDGWQEVRLVRAGTYTLEGSAGDTVSLIPFGGAARGIHTENLYYPLNHETLEFGPARGVSNVMETSAASIRFEAGLLLLVHTIGRA